MKKYLYILLIITMAACSHESRQRKGKLFFSINSTFIERDGKYAIANENGEPLTDCIFDDLQGLSNGNILATENGKYYILRSNGTKANNIGFTEFTYCYNGCAIVKEGSKYGVVDIGGKMLLPPKYDTVKFISSHFAAATKGSITTVVDRLGFIIDQTHLHPDSLTPNLLLYQIKSQENFKLSEEYWSGILQRYETLCNSCIQAKFLIKSKSQNYNEEIKLLMQEASAIEEELAGSIGQMTPEQFEQFQKIVDKYAEDKN